MRNEREEAAYPSDESCKTVGTRQGQITLAMNRLSVTNEILASVVEKLAKRVSPVTDYDLRPEDCNKESSAPGSELARYLFNENRRVEEQIKTIVEITESIDL